MVCPSLGSFLWSSQDHAFMATDDVKQYILKQYIFITNRIAKHIFTLFLAFCLLPFLHFKKQHDELSCPVATPDELFKKDY